MTKTNLPVLPTATRRSRGRALSCGSETSVLGEDDIGVTTMETRMTLSVLALATALGVDDNDDDNGKVVVVAGNLSNKNPLMLQLPQRQFLANFASYAALVPLTLPILDWRRFNNDDDGERSPPPLLGNLPP